MCQPRPVRNREILQRLERRPRAAARSPPAIAPGSESRAGGLLDPAPLARFTLTLYMAAALQPLGDSKDVAYWQMRYAPAPPVL